MRKINRSPEPSNVLELEVEENAPLDEESFVQQKEQVLLVNENESLDEKLQQEAPDSNQEEENNDNTLTKLSSPPASPVRCTRIQSPSPPTTRDYVSYDQVNIFKFIYEYVLIRLEFTP